MKDYCPHCREHYEDQYKALQYNSKMFIHCYSCSRDQYTFQGNLLRTWSILCFWFSIIFLPGSATWKSWWSYLFEKRADKDVPWITVLLCRLRGHPTGPIWYTSTRMEPDMRCRTCWDDLG